MTQHDCKKCNCNENIELVKRSSALKQLIDCLQHSKYDIKYIALNTLVNIIEQSDNDKTIDNCLNMGICDK